MLAPPAYPHCLHPVPSSPRSAINTEPDKVWALCVPEGILIWVTFFSCNEGWHSKPIQHNLYSKTPKGQISDIIKESQATVFHLFNSGFFLGSLKSPTPGSREQRAPAEQRGQVYASLVPISKPLLSFKNESAQSCLTCVFPNRPQVWVTLSRSTGAF